MKFNNYQHFQKSVSKKLSKNLKKITSSANDLAETLAEELVNHIQGKPPQHILNFALDFIRPYIQTLGLRVSKLTSENVEVVIPGKVLYQDVNQNLDEGALISASLFAFKKLWKKNSPKGHFKIEIKKIEFEKIRDPKAPVRIRLELSAMTRETIFADLVESKTATQDIMAHILDSELQVLAKVHIQAELSLLKAINWN
jgi:hypothetical protein